MLSRPGTGRELTGQALPPRAQALGAENRTGEDSTAGRQCPLRAGGHGVRGSAGESRAPALRRDTSAALLEGLEQSKLGQRGGARVRKVLWGKWTAGQFLGTGVVRPVPEGPP